MARRPSSSRNQRQHRRSPQAKPSPARGRQTPASKRLPLPEWVASSATLMWGAAALYVVICAVLSFGYWSVGGYGVETDALGGYLPETQNLLNGKFTPLDGFKGPGYHLAVAAVGLFVRDLFWAAKIIALVAAGAVLVLLFRLASRHLGRAVGWVAVLIVATNAQFVLYTIQVGTDMYFLALAVGTAVFLLERRTAWRALFAGALAGLAYLTRYNGLFLVVGGLGIMLLADRESVGLRARLLRTGAFFAAVCAAILPWSLFTWSRGVGFFYNQNHLNIAYELYGRDVVSWDQFWAYFSPAFTSFGDVLGANPGRFAKMVLANSAEHLWLDWRLVLVAGEGRWVVPVAILWGLTLGVGLVLVLRRYRWSAWPSVFLGLLAYGVLVPVFYGERFSLPMVPVYAVLVAAAVVWMAREVRQPYVVRFAPAAAFVVFLWAGGRATFSAVEGLLANSPQDVELIAQTIDHTLPKGERILARKPHIAYFLGLQFVRMPMLNSLDELPEIARSTHARYLFVSGIEAALRRPLIPLLDQRNAPPFLKPIAATSGQPAVLYEFAMDVPPMPPPRPTAKASAPEAPQAVRLGRAYLAAGRADLAHEQFMKALAENPDEPTAHLGLIQIDEARAQSALRNPDAPVEARSGALRALAEVERKLTNLAGRFPNSHEVQLALGDLLVRRNKHREAIEAYRRAVKLDPNDPLILGVLGDLERTTEQYAEAEDLYRRLLSLTPDDPEAHRALGQVLLAQNRAAEALDHLRRAFAMDSTSVQTRAALARAYKAVGDSTKAQPLWEEVLRQSTPGDPLHFEASIELGLTPSFGP